MIAMAAASARSAGRAVGPSPRWHHPRDLRHVVDVLPRDVVLVQQHVDGSLLGMGAAAAPARLVETLEDAEVLAPDLLEALERLLGIHLHVASLDGQRLLVVAGEHRIILVEHASNSSQGTLVGVADMRHHLYDRPLAVGWAAAPRLLVEAADEPAQHDRGPAQDLEDLLALAEHRSAMRRARARPRMRRRAARR